MGGARPNPNPNPNPNLNPNPSPDLHITLTLTLALNLTLTLTPTLTHGRRTRPARQVDLRRCSRVYRYYRVGQRWFYYYA